MRTLTDAQRLTEDYRDADRHQNLVRRRLLADVQAVLQTNAAIKDAAQDCLTLVDTSARTTTRSTRSRRPGGRRFCLAGQEF